MDRIEHIASVGNPRTSTKPVQPVPVIRAVPKAAPFRLLAISLAGTFAFLDLYSVQPVLPLMARVFHATAGQAGMAVSATTFGVALSAPFAGMIADRLGRKKVIVGSLFGLVVPTVLASTASTLAALVVWRFLIGLCTPGIIAGALAYIAEEFSRDRSASAVATYVTGTILGGFLGRMLTGLIADFAGWRAAFFILGVVTLVGAVSVARFLPESRRFVPQHGWRRGLSDFGHHLRNPLMLATYAVGFSVLFSLVATFTYITFHLAERPYMLGAAAQGALFMVYLLGLFVTPASGKWVLRFGHGKAVAAAAATASVGVLLTLAGSLWLIVAGLALCSAGVFVCQAAASGFVGAAADRARSAAAGLYVACYYLGGSAGAVAPGIIWDRAGWTGCVALIVAVQLSAAVLAVIFWKKPIAPAGSAEIAW
jgi:predicted MFS family arabinose efflux permease